MENARLGAVEARFADIIWKNEPLTTRELIKLCEKELDWKRTTTYTVLKKLCERGIFLTDNSMVSALISKEEFYAIQSENFVKDTFDGSLPAFLAAFTARKALTENEVNELRKMVKEYEEGRK